MFCAIFIDDRTMTIISQQSWQFKFKQLSYSVRYPQGLHSTMNNRNLIDFFKIFKIFDLKKLDKQGEVKVMHDKILGRKVLAAEGNVSTNNYITLKTSTVRNVQPSLTFSHRYLYVVGFMESGKHFCFQIHAQFNAKAHKVLFSTLYKAPKKGSNGVLQMPIQKMKSQMWTIIVIDLNDICQRHIDGGQIKLSFRLDQIEIRASSKIRNIYQSDTLFDPYSLPMDMQLPLKDNEDFYQKYNYFMYGQLQNENSSKNQQKIIQMTDNPIIQDRKQATKSMKRMSTHSNTKQVSQVHRKEKKQPKTYRNYDAQENLNDGCEDQEVLPRANLAPKPKVIIEAKLAAVEGVSLFVDNVRTIQAFVTYPTLFAVHKPISCMSIKNTNLCELAVAYTDGSVSIWDIIRHKPLCYLQTLLKSIKQIECVESLQSQRFRIYMVGEDSKRRETILVISQSQILYQKISNYPIAGFHLAPINRDSNMVITFGHENIRIWRENPHNSILSGVGIYLGKMNRKISYNSCCQMGEKLLLVADSGGYITSINLQEEKMQEMRKVSDVAIDHILHLPQLHRIVIINFHGQIKVFDYDLKVVDELELGSRVKNVSYRIEAGQAILNVHQYNKSTAYLNIDKGDYSFIGRSHTAPVLRVEFMRKVSKIVTISQDSTIRIWELGESARCHYESNSNRLQWQIKQEYQFVVQSGESLSNLVTDDSQYIYVSFHGGRVRKINVLNYQIEIDCILDWEHEEDKTGQTVLVITHSEMSKNGKNIMFCAEERVLIHSRNPENQHKTTIHQGKSSTPSDYRTVNTMVIMTDRNLKGLTTYRSPSVLSSHRPNKVLSRFSSTHKKFCICWVSDEMCQVQIFDMRDLLSPKCQFYLQSIPETVEHRENVIACYSIEQTYEEYSQDTGELLEVIQLNSQQGNSRLVQFPYLIDSRQDYQLQISGLGGSKSDRVTGVIDLAEPVSNLRLYPNVKSTTKDTDGVSENMIICTGERSNALYAINLVVTNAQQLYHIERTKKKDIGADNRQILSSKKPDRPMTEEVQLPVLMNQFLYEDKNEHNAIVGHGENISNQFDDIVYEGISQQQEQPSHVSNQPLQFKKLYQREEEMMETVQHIVMPKPLQSEQRDGSYIRQQQDIGTSLIFGWNKAYNVHKRTQLIWQPARQSLLLVSHKSLILHYFREPVSQKIIKLLIEPSILDKMGKHIFVVMGNQIKLYDEEMNYIRCLIAAGCTVESMSLSICGSFVIVLSRDAENSKTFIQVIDLITTNTICSTYLPVCDKESHNVLVNPFQSCLEFIVYYHENILFYRMTSIMTLQVQELPKVKELISTNAMGQLTCLTFIKVEEEELAIFGTHDGSMLIVDSRAAQILIVCRNLVKCAICDLLYEETIDESNGSKQAKLCIITQSNTITVFELIDPTFKALIRTVEQQPDCLLTIDSKVCMNSKINKMTANSLALLALSKYHTLWLVDISDRETIKVMSAHSETNGNLLISEAALLSDDSFISGASDGCLKLTSLRNLQQINQIYKPKRKVTDILLTTSMLVVSFDSEVYFYSFQSNQVSEWAFLGSTNLPHSVVKMQNISNTDNYLICTLKSLYMIFHDKSSQKFKLQIQSICDNLSHPMQLDLAGYNLVLVRQAAKIDVWLRKQKRNQNILKQMSEIEEIKYYTMDVYQTFSVCAHFVAGQKTDQIKEYIVCLAEKPVFQFRDFHEHTVVREIEIGVSAPTFMLEAKDSSHYFVGDETGYIYRINHNGLVLEKIRALESPIKGIKLFNQQIRLEKTGQSHSKLLVFGNTVAVLNI